MENKKGQQMTLGTIIAIVLGLVVLVFLIYGFSTGWGSLWEKVTGLGGGDVNVDTMSTACTLACQQDNQYGFCNQSRTIVVSADAAKEAGNCTSFATKGYVDKCSITC
ncbi:hypothetical protein HN903_04680 [archaeon]|jgi:hypothetical protein|nr:hypothetical protein [archaeon]MBT7129024.1 hypothetical protein [archaeon]